MKTQPALKWLMLVSMLCGTHYAAACTATDLRDAMIDGLLDYTTSTVTESLTNMLPIFDVFAAGQSGA